MISLSASTSIALFREKPPRHFGFRLVSRLPHDRNAFTQGLHLEPGGTLLESTGLYGESTIRRTDPLSGRIIQSEKLPDEWFGEGLTSMGERDGRCIQLLWRERLILVRDLRTLSLMHTVELPASIREGWGITHGGDGKIYVSDGTAQLHVLDAETFQKIDTVHVRAGWRALSNLNELQWVRGDIWSNIWREERIAVINAETGVVRCFVDLSELLTPEERAQLQYEEVLNGCAYCAATDRLFVTGKRWPCLYQIAVDMYGEVIGSGHPLCDHNSVRWLS